MISIIIPVYNGEKYIAQAIDSALKQTWDDIEIIVVDDGSTDKTAEIIDNIPGIGVLHKSNGGTGSALNAGIQVAQGDWIKWLSADDVLYPKGIEWMMWGVASTPAHDNCIFYSSYDIIDSTGKIIKEYMEEPKVNQMQTMMKAFYGNGSSSLIHRNVFKKIGLFAEMPHSEDYEFWLRALYNGIRMECVRRKTIQYRYHKDQLTKTKGGSLDKEIRDQYA